MAKLLEGMRAGDLEDLVLPMVSVDEFASKVGDDAMVFGFYVSDRDAAMDLNRFIQKSPIKLLDTEVSPAPDQRGYYVVFFEVLLNDRLPESVCDLLKEIAPLVKVEKWKLQVRGQDDLCVATEDVMQRVIKSLRKEIEDKKKNSREKEAESNPNDEKDAASEKTTKAMNESILSFLTPSELSHAALVRGNIVLEGRGQQITAKVVAFGTQSDVSSLIEETPMSHNFRQVAEDIRVSRMLGEGWNVSSMGEFRTIQFFGDDRTLVVRLSM